MKECYKNLPDFAYYKLSSNEDFVNECRKDFEAIMVALRENTKDVRVLGSFKTGLCPELQYFKLDFLEEKDHPHGIAENSVYVLFKVNLVESKIEVHSYGHIWLSPEEQKKTNLAMTGLKNVAEARGVKWFRKQSYKDTKTLVKKVVTFYKSLFKPLEDYTGGYPYKKGITWVKAA